jgi:hypothetical protein
MFRLADFLAHKYELVSEGASLQSVLRDVETKVKDAYRNYIDLKTVTSKAYNAIPIMAHQGEPHCQKIVGHMQIITANINELVQHPARLFKAINKILALISSLDEAIKNTKKKSSEHLPTQQALNANLSDLSRLENSLKRFSSLMVGAAKLLKPFVPPDDEGKEAELEGNVVVPEALPLTKHERRQFFLEHPNEVAAYGFDGPDLIGNLDIVLRILEEPGMAREFDKFARAVKGKGNPENGAKIREMAQNISALIQRQKSTNLSALESKPTFEE